MKNKADGFIAIVTISVFLLVSCSVAPTTSVSIPPTSTTTPLPASTGTPTITPVPPTPTLVPETAFIKGITLNYSGNGPKLGTAGAQEVVAKYIIPSGANYVVLVPSCWSVNMRDTSIICPKENIEGGVPAISDAELIGAIQYLHSVGLRVAFKAQALIQSVHIAEDERKERHWTEEQWEEWFNSYTQFITHYAQIAENYQVDLFVVGNEQEDNTSRERNWREVIAAVRNVYHGPITYAANAWSFEAYRIRFWDALDYIGTNGYQFGFLDKKNPTIEDRVQAWQPYIQKLEELSKQYGKQVIITEIGALAMQDFSTGRTNGPHWVPLPYDGQEQADYYIAFFEALKDKPWLKGILLWDIDTNPSQGGPYDIGYTFIAKPTEEVVHQYFGGTLIVSTPVPDFVEDPANSMWIYREKLENKWWMWDQEGSMTLSDLSAPIGYQSAHSIREQLSKIGTLTLIFDADALHMLKYKWIEFYIMVGDNQPKNLLAALQDWSPNAPEYRSALVDDPRYIEGGKFQPGTWQRVRIPLVDLGISNQIFKYTSAFNIRNCSGWPCGSNSIAGDIHIDDIRLIAGK